MRDRDTLRSFEDMKILYQYLYISGERVIVIHNVIDVPLRLRMNDNGVILCKNMNFPEGEETDYTEHMTIQTVKAIVEQLQETPAVDFPDSFASRWEEIKSICCVDMSLNKPKDYYQIIN